MTLGYQRSGISCQLVEALRAEFWIELASFAYCGTAMAES